MANIARLTGHEAPINKIFSNDFAFRIPAFQRPYAWTTEQAGELFDDLIAAYNGGEGLAESSDPYFLGSIVIVKGDAADAQVIDGQQRLTTLTILLSAARCLLDDPEATDIDGFLHEKGSRITGIPDRPRVLLRQRDQEFFEKHIQRRLTEPQKQNLAESLGKPLEKDRTSAAHPLLALSPSHLSDSQTNIRNNFECLLKRLYAVSPDNRLGLVRYTITKCFLVVVATPSLNAACRIFSVLNNRGLDLTHADILKADILGQVGRDKEDIYTKKWEDKEEEIGRDAFSDLFAHIRMIYARAKLKKTVLEEFRGIVIPKFPNAAQLIDDVIIPHADSLEDISQRTFVGARHQDAINGLLRWLSRIDNFDWIPPAILYMTRNREQPDAIFAFLQDLERLASSMFIRRCDINERITRYGRLIQWIDEGKDLYLPDSPLQLSADEQVKTLKGLDNPVYEATKTRLYIMLRLDSFLSSGGVEYDHSVITLEHVLPQTVGAGSEWEKTWPEEDVRLNWVNRIGNLLLLTQRKNSEAQNFDFAVKKSKYFISPKGVANFALTTQVLSEDKWLPETVSRRQQDLLQVLKKGWRL